MCGIGGYLARTPVKAEVATAMQHALKQRGPDRQQIVRWNDDAGMIASDAPSPIALIHTRLAIMDPRPEADQPMSSEDGQIWLVYNGEVYDWQEDAAYLRSQQVRFRSHSDTEFILHAYAHWGIDMIHRLRGKFALAILDWRSQELWLATDRLGLKPLLYSMHDGNLAFASLLRALLPTLSPQQRQWNPYAIDAYLAHRSIPCPQTILQGVNRMPAGHLARFDLRDRSFRLHRYWQLEDVTGQKPGTWPEQLSRAIDLRTVADRPVGIFLSGGIDSTVIASELSRTGHRDLTAFTAGFNDPRFDESSDALRTAEYLGLHAEIMTIPQDVEGDLDQIIADLDEPFADPSAIPLWYLSRMASQTVKVALTGDGGDELLGGYKRYSQHLRSAWRGQQWKIPLHVPASPYSKGWMKILLEAGMSWQDAYLLRFSGFHPGQRLYLQPELETPLLHYWTLPEKLQGMPPLEQLLAIDRNNVLPDYILRKADLCSMCHGLELRAPLLDYRFIEALYAQHAQELYTQPAKQIFRSFAPALDELGLFSRKKRGFNPPLQHLASNPVLLAELDQQLDAITQGQISATSVRTMLGADRKSRLISDEQVLQLIFLNKSLQQIKAL